MKIALLINSLQGGGAERVVLSLAEGFLNKNMIVELICIERKNSYSIPEGLKVNYLTQHQLIKNNLLKLFYIPILGFRLKKMIRNKGFTSVQSHLIRANILNVTSKIFSSSHHCIIVNHNMVSFTSKLGLKGRIKLFIMQYFYSRADMVLYISRVMQQDFVKTFKLKNKSRVIFNPHQIHAIYDKAHAPVYDFIFDPEKHYIVTSGRLIKRKRIKDIIAAIIEARKVIPKIELIVLGNGPEEENIKEYIQKTKAFEFVHLLGFSKNPFPYIKQSNIFVMASEREGLPNALIESMACKTTVVSSDCQSGPREIIAPDSELFFKLNRGYENASNGTLFAIGDIQSLSKILIELLNDPVRNLQLAENAFKRVETFSVEKIIEAHEQILI